MQRFLGRRLGGEAGQWIVSAPKYGTTGTVSLARREGGVAAGEPGRCVLHAFRGWGPMHRYVRQLRMLERHGLPTPRPLAATPFWEAWPNRRPWLAAESWLAGEPVYDVEPCMALAEDLGRALGALHAVRAARFEWGGRRQGAEAFGERCRQLVAERCAMARRELERAGEALRNPALKQAIEAEFNRLERRLRNWEHRGPFVLVHGELGANDMLWDAGRRRISFVDVGAMRFDHRHFDFLTALWLVEAMEEGCRAGLAKRYVETYWAGAGAEYRPAAEEDAPVLGALLDAMRISTRARAMRQRPEKREKREEQMEALVEKMKARALGTKGW